MSPACSRQAGSDLQGSRWLKTVEYRGFEGLEVQHLYRATGFLHDVRHDLERELFFRDLNLFNQKLDLVFPACCRQGGHDF